MKREYSMPSMKAVATHFFGSQAFWFAVEALFANALPRRYLNWDEWDEFFRIAEDNDMNVFTDQAKKVPVRTPIFWSLLRTYRAVQAAKAAGMSPHDFHDAERRRIEREDADREYSANKHIEIARFRKESTSRRRKNYQEAVNE